MAQKNGVIFIHGLDKKAEQWNVSEFDKNINIEKTIGMKYETILIQLDDFKINPDEICAFIIKQTESSLNSKNKIWTIVCHSLAALYALQLLKYDEIKINGIVLVDPTPLDDLYTDYLRKKGWDDLANYIDTENIKPRKPPSPKIKFHVHLDYNFSNINKFNNQIEFYSRYANPNSKSKIIIHPNKGHMIHYTDGPKIIESILSILKN